MREDDYSNPPTIDEVGCFLRFILDKVEDVYYQEARLAAARFYKALEKTTKVRK